MNINITNRALKKKKKNYISLFDIWMIFAIFSVLLMKKKKF